ncbi:hypothetical protein ACEWY4_017366 [Coilia grayii]|uniref:Uncharacterized protein n=1 Tax=Coilia grayii TaxID=363190 RepID=A0ABD1JGY2_9TELE
MDSLVLEVWRIMVILSLPALTQCSPLFVMSAPNLLRVGAPERVFVEAQDYAGSAFEVTVRVQDYPYKTRELANQTVQLRQDNNYQALAEITIPEGNDVFEEDDTVNQYVYLLAQFPGQLLERVVLVSFQSGYIFVQTDKTIYTPSSTVQYRIYTLGLSMRPSDRPITVDVVDPEGVVVSRDALTPHEGVCSGAYKVQAFDSIGSWKIVTRFKSTPQNNFTYEFKVKNYVLPQVEVTLAPLKSYFYIDDEELIVNISARYLNKMEVTGMGFVVFSLQGLGTDYRHIASTQRVKITGGRGHATLTRERLLQVTPGTADIQHLTGTFIHVNVTVVTQTGYDTAYASISGIQIVTSPYTIHYKKTPRYFKPGMPFTCMIFVTNPDGSPAEGVEVQISNKKSSEISGITRTNGLVKLTVNTDKKDSLLLINAVTKDRNLTDARQARQSMTAFPYETKAGSENYLHIDIDATEQTIGDPVKVNLILRGSPGDQNQDLTCLILSKGQLVSAGRAKPEGKAVVSLTLTVTRDMVPSFRIVAYYHVGSSEVVSDSVWVDVKDTCREKLKVRPYRPGEAYVRKIFSLEITGDPGARVGLVVVDKGVYMLNNKHRLTQTKIWNTVEKLDAGCTAGSGKDSMGVFYDAGLVFETSTAGGTHSRTGSHCPSPRRQQRSLEDEEEVMAIFDDVISRSHFQESFFWQEEQLPTCDHGEKQCTSTSIRKDIVVTDAIAGWHISAVSLSDTSGICVADAFDISKAASFSLDLKIPPFCKCNEQLEIIAIVHNPQDEDMRVHLKLVETPTICSSATDRGGYVTTVEVRARTTHTVPFVIVPMETGTQSIVVAAADALWRTDGVQKDIVVLPVGVPRRTTVQFDMNPSVSGGYLTSVIGPWLIGVYDPIPNMPVHHIITAQAQPLVSRMEAVLSGDSVAPLLLRSGLGGGGEQDLVAMTTPLIANYYLDRTQQLLERRAEAVSIIRAGYHKLLTYRKQDGSFSVSKTTQSSTWLTAYVAKVFSMASGIISVDGQAICSALLWLVAHTQNPDGSFQELSPVPYTVSSTGNVYGKDRDASMTAFVLAAMQESPSALCTDKKITSSISRATHYLGLRIHTLTNPYAVAMALSI